MLPLDHIPLYCQDDLDGLAAAFRALGFTVTPPGVYTTPQDSGARWRCRDVFLREGWFDLLLSEDAVIVGEPAAALFRAETLDEVPDLPLGPRFDLLRQWPGHSLGVESFTFASVKARVAPFGLGVIAHAWPCPDIRSEWLEHPNTALTLGGVIFGGAVPGPAASKTGAHLDLSSFEYWDARAYAGAFGSGAQRRCAIRIGVADLDRCRAVLRGAGLRVTEVNGGLGVPAPPPLSCAFLFVSAD